MTYNLIISNLNIKKKKEKDALIHCNSLFMCNGKKNEGNKKQILGDYLIPV